MPHYQERGHSFWTTIASGLLMLGLAWLLGVVMLGCGRQDTERAKGPDTRAWAFVAMSGGPPLWTACVHGNRLYATGLPNPGGRFAEIRTLTVVYSGC